MSFQNCLFISKSLVLPLTSNPLWQ